MYATTVDSIIDNLTDPEKTAFSGKTMLKIDVDSPEHEVILGSIRSLSSQFFKTILVEIDINDPKHLKAREFLKAFGYLYDQSQVQASLNYNRIHFPSMPSICNHRCNLSN